MTPQEELEVFKDVLHRIHVYRSISMDEKKLIELLNLISNWSYAHREGNGELDNDKLVEEATLKLKR